ncbi:pH-response regulator protein palH/rim21 [Recurvomyces mirabilis]|uniref:PH-response regulator protein palH/rim21 n=1 Tax=Recurvomyces mirabilis TaxID=574656 RepID=A0AAE0WXF7_9PEZI|nr:pH-response regulator protein palH/rim21 [Recurvomyces mirabilis]KAK5162263.1 pH-response regulator protein palH/rim21 [Recurvomyces mirabilis]
MLPTSTLDKRQLWNTPPTETTTWGDAAHCTPFVLPSRGILSFASTVITLSTNILFQPECTGAPLNGISTVDQFKDPFYASTTPQTYVVAATTMIAWVLVVMLTITPRTSFLGNPSAGPAFGNGHGIIGGATGGGTNLIGVGSRPWLQKIAALTVAVSLTIATADTFREAEKQYNRGYMNASTMREEVLGSLEIRITRVISDIFLWLAQVQTLIRLFPRHKEKVLIKWIGFALIIFDSLFSCLNSFLVDRDGRLSRPEQFQDAIPALSYLFELALGLLYAAWVMFYAVTKRRYSFYHSKMRSIGLIALLSLVAVLTPVVFFVTDVSNQDVAGWGDYFRWVGAAAASVVVWEWVERIEALERDEKKDGILGREIFDGDEMLDVTPSEEAVWSQSRRTRDRLKRGSGRSDDDRDDGNQTSALEMGFSGMAKKLRRTQQAALRHHFPLGRAHSSTNTSGATTDPNAAASGNGRITFDTLPKPADSRSSHQPLVGHPAPPPVASPVSRADTASAASTVYVVRYDTAANAPQPVRRRLDRDANGNAAAKEGELQQHNEKNEATGDEDEPKPDNGRRQEKWYAVANPFKRKRASPPAEVQQARQAATASQMSRSATPSHNFSRWDIKNQLGVLAAQAGERVHDRRAGRHQEADLPVTIIPAQPRGSGRTWSPEVLGRPEPNPRGPHDNHDERADMQRGQHDSPLGGGDAISPPIKTRSNLSPPPRADDITPAGGRIMIVPAPRRSPLRQTTSAQDSPGRSSGSTGSDATPGASRDGGAG